MPARVALRPVMTRTRNIMVKTSVLGSIHLHCWSPLSLVVTSILQRCPGWPRAWNNNVQVTPRWITHAGANQQYSICIRDGLIVPQPRGLTCLMCNVPCRWCWTKTPISEGKVQLKRIIALEHGQATNLTPFPPRVGTPVFSKNQKQTRIYAAVYPESLRRCTQNHLNIDQCHSPGNVYPCDIPVGTYPQS